MILNPNLRWDFLFCDLDHIFLDIKPLENAYKTEHQNYADLAKLRNILYDLPKKRGSCWAKKQYGTVENRS